MEAVTPTDVNTWNVVSQACQIELQNTVVVSVITPYQLARLLTTLITLADSIKMTAMVNSGAMGNFIHPWFVKEHKLVTKNCTPLIMNDVNGQSLSHVDQQVEVWMMVRNHAETLTFDILPLGKHNIVLGLPWLQWHNPTIHWTSRKVTFTSDYCEEHCLAQPASTFLNQHPIVSWVMIENKVSGLTVEPLSEQEINLFAVEILEHLESVAKHIPELYHIKINVFNGQKAVNMLPPLCSPDVDFTIKLDKTKLLLKPSHPYHMNQEEHAECWRLLDEGLESGLCKDIAIFPLFFPYFPIPLHSITSETLCSTTNPQSTNFSIFHWLLSCITLFSSSCVDRCELIAYMKHSWHMTSADNYWNAILPACIPQYHTAWVSYVVYIHWY